MGLSGGAISTRGVQAARASKQNIKDKRVITGSRIRDKGIARGKKTGTMVAYLF